MFLFLLHAILLMQSFLEARPVFSSLFNRGTFYINADGVATASYPVLGRIGLNYADRDYFQAQVARFAAEGQMSSAEVGAINDSERTKLDGYRLVFDAARANAEIGANVGMTVMVQLLAFRAQDFAAHGRGRYPAQAAVEQRHPKVVLEFFQLRGERGLADMAALCSLAKMLEVGVSLKTKLVLKVSCRVLE